MDTAEPISARTGPSTSSAVKGRFQDRCRSEPEGRTQGEARIRGRVRMPRIGGGIWIVGFPLPKSSQDWERGGRVPHCSIYLKPLRLICTPRGMYHLPERADDAGARQLPCRRHTKLAGRDGKICTHIFFVSAFGQDRGWIHVPAWSVHLAGCGLIPVPFYFPTLPPWK